MKTLSVHLSPLGVMERDAFPALVFVRDSAGRLQLYALSREFAAMIQQLALLQIS